MASEKGNILAVAKKNLGFDALRPGQEEPIRSILQKKDTLVVMPTGSGKSAIYQIAGLMLEGCVLVISPLIALQKDQVDSINKQNAEGEAVVVNSTQRVAETREAFEKIDHHRHSPPGRRRRARSAAHGRGPDSRRSRSLEAAQAAARQQERRREAKRERLRQMEEYASTSACRREQLLRYFGDDCTGPCNNCDNCKASAPAIDVDPSVGTRREVA